MTYEEVMSTLEKMGTVQNIKIYRRHGAGDNLFGVSFANLNALKKKIKSDQALAEKLWESGNADARSLALMIADPKSLSAKTVESWVRDISYYLLSDLLAHLVAESPFALQTMAKWIKSKNEHIRHTGYSLMACMLKNGCDVSDDQCREYLETIEREIHLSPNRARHAMNNALIAIGIYRPTLTEGAIATARRTGRVEVDHGETSCKTPDAESYIKKALERKKVTRKR